MDFNSPTSPVDHLSAVGRPSIAKAESYSGKRQHKFKGSSLTVSDGSSSSESSEASPSRLNAASVVRSQSPSPGSVGGEEQPATAKQKSNRPPIQTSDSLKLKYYRTMDTPATAPVNGRMQQSPGPVPSTSAAHCFLHSRLDDSLSAFHRREKDSKKGDRLRLTPVHDTLTRHLVGSVSPTDEVRTPKSHARPTPHEFAATADSDDSDGSMTEDGNESDEGTSLTRRLAETAVSVREMAKQLGRARLKSNINSILIITKARDNHLIKLTRDLAIWIMTEMRQTSREKSSGITVYVDAQLRHSKRFDAAGIQRDYPQILRPLMRRFSRRSSSSNLHGNGKSQMHSSSASLSASQTFVSHARTTSSKSQSASVSATPSRHDSTFPGDVSSPTSLITALSSVSLASHTSISGKQSQNHQRHASSIASEHGEDSEGQLRYWTAEMCTKSPHLFDYVITLGGDGTVLFASWLFQRTVPPIIPFSLGSLGFLTNFDYQTFKKTLTTVQNEGARINLRMRFTCTVYRAVDSADKRRTAVRSGKTGEIYMQDLDYGDWDTIESGGQRLSDNESRSKDKEVLCFSTRPAEQFEVINELVISRGPSPYVSLLELFGDEHHMTTVQADGLCVSTPTGSTAYSLSAGGSLVHPESPAILVSPICPHTLSFRPIILPDSMELRVCVPYNSRSTAWASFDGRGQVELRQGDHIKVTASTFPFPTVCADKQSTDFFNAISRTLKWNERQRQKSFVVVEEERVDEGEDGYDIDDISDVSNPPSPAPNPMQSNPGGKVPPMSLGGIAEDNRFAQAQPHPPKLSQRHSYQHHEDFQQPTRSRGSTTVAPIREGEVGDRDDLREPLERKRRPAALKTVKTDTSLPTQHKSPESDGISRRRTDTSSAPRAFAVFGDDSSDVSDGVESS